MTTDARLFDCVAARTEAATRISRRISRMSREEELAYWRLREAAIEAWLDACRDGRDVPFPVDEDDSDGADLGWGAAPQQPPAVRATPKAFDCVEMKGEGQARLQARLAGMSRDDELAYWQRREDALRAWREAIRQGLDAPFPADEGDDPEGDTAT
jgi:hypothetical protein